MIRVLEQVTGGVIKRFLDSKGVPKNCPLCSQDEMSISIFDPEGEQAGTGKAPAVRVIHELPDGTHRGYGEFLRVCLNCGYIHYIRDTEVLAFMDEGGDNEL
ncbi:hypothetical protein QT231_24070 [Halomonas sp. SpR1]|uniref:hypothetical protein n=1 Tax=Halomonas sp. SpR1 TaxID=3050462 RepID=UPI0027E3FE85|nr:hypothetical protein [Halomonas sp. SpR1]MDQ7735781.1 hypothetical protein [Halomonas sp. SpR1]